MRAALLLLTIGTTAALAAPKRGVEILWDRFGVAHVYARNAEGLFFGYGYAQMQSHGDLILKLYGESRGRAAEYWGEKNLALDRWVHVNGVPERGLAWYRQQTPEFRRYLDAFAAGMNEYATRHADKLDPERRKALPITGADPVIHFHRIVHFSYVSSMARVEAAATGRPPGLGGIGSNAWAIAPSKSESGRPMILMNPHLPWSDWYTYYEIHLNAPGMNLYGASQVGFPVLRFVFTDHLAFTQTVNSIDASDLYRITPDGDGYRFDGEKRAFEVVEKTIAVKDRAPERLRVKSTVHGPVVWERDGLILAQRTASLDRPFGIEQYWKMAIAKSFSEYQAQVKRLEVPTFNITYADKQGHVMYLFNGTLPVRSKGDVAFWSGIVPGDTAETLWTKTHPYEDLPKVIDPPSGFVQNTNDPPWTATYPIVLDPGKFAPYTAPKSYSMRSSRSLRMLRDDSKISFDELAQYKLSTRLELADRILDDLLAAAGDTPAARVLKAWDRQTENDSKGALLFEAWAQKFGQAFAVPQDWAQPFDTPRGLKDPADAARKLEQAAAEVEKNYGALDAAWGDFRRLKRGNTELPGNGAPGGLGAFRVLQFAGQSARKNAVTGDTFVCLVEFGNPIRAQVLTSYGNSSQPGSPHGEDQLPLVSAKKLRPVWRTRAEVEAHVESKDTF